MKKSVLTDIICLLLIVTVIGIPIAIYLLRKRENYGKSNNVLKPSNEVKEKSFEEEKRKFTPLYTETTILPVLTEEDLKKYKKKEIKEVPKKEVVNETKQEIKKANTEKKKKKNKLVKTNYYYKKNGKNYYKSSNKQKKKGV